MAGFGIEVDVCVPDVNEAAIGGDDPLEVAARRAQAKFDAVAVRRADDVIVAADTVVVVDGARLGKPADLDDARHMLERLSGQTIAITTSVVAGRADDAHARQETTLVTLRELSANEIEQYLDTADVLDKAGALALQDAAADFVDRLEGCWSNVVGLPVCVVAEQLGMPAGKCRSGACGR